MQFSYISVVLLDFRYSPDFLVQIKSLIAPPKCKVKVCQPLFTVYYLQHTHKDEEQSFFFCRPFQSKYVQNICHSRDCQVWINTHAHVRTHTRTRARTHTHTHTLSHTHTHTHTHTLSLAFTYILCKHLSPLPLSLSPPFFPLPHSLPYSCRRQVLVCETVVYTGTVWNGILLIH